MFILCERKLIINKKSKRLGRGVGCGKGKTCGRGTKGQKARSGKSTVRFSGGQGALYLRVPKRGFNSLSKNRKQCSIFNISFFNILVESGKITENSDINSELLHSLGYLDDRQQSIKLLARGEKISANLNFFVDSVSAKARQIVEQNGGKINLVGKNK